MNLQEYYQDLRKVLAKLENEHADDNGVVYVTSLFHRERNSTPGCTLSASCRNAARVITDGTHRLAEPSEIKAFLDHQQDQLKRNTQAEQANRKQFIVVVNDKDATAESSVLTGGIKSEQQEKTAPAKK